MAPPKRSIRDFFAPAPSDRFSHPSQQSSPPQDTDTIVVNVPQARASNMARGSQITPAARKTAQPSTAKSTSEPATSIAHAARERSAEARPPSTSQSSANSSTSRRVLSNGEQVVLNSDSDTDSLPDLDWGEPSTSFKVTTQSTRAKAKREVKDDSLRTPPKKVKGGNKSFSLLVETAQKNAETEQRIAERRAEVEKPIEEISARNFVMSEEALANVVRDDEDPDKARRLYLAMQRTNALHTEYAFNFFEEKPKSNPMPMPFPLNSLPYHRWTSSFADPSTRDQAFLSGFAQQIFQIQQLPEELASWMIEQICISGSEALSAKYIQLLNTHGHHLQTLLDRDKLETVVEAAGADLRCLTLDREVEPSFKDHSTTGRPLPTPLKSIINLIRIAAPYLHTSASSHALYILCHICMDDSVIANAGILHIIQDAIEAIICNITNNEQLAVVLNDVVPLLLSRVKHAILQKNLVCSLPAKSPLTAYLQRHLALAFLIHPTSLDIPLSSKEIPSLIHTHLHTSPYFKVTRETDYTCLATRLTLLDIAIGPGPLEVPYQPLVSPPESVSGSSPVMAPLTLSSGEKDFNKEVDALSQHIKLLGNSIIEAGAVADLTRLDAKDCIERLTRRLEHGVRIGGKKMNNIFEDENAVERGQKLFSRFLKSASRSTTATANGIVSGTKGHDNNNDALDHDMDD